MKLLPAAGMLCALLPLCGPTQARDFLSDGGGIRGDAVQIGGGSNFLEDGGSIRNVPIFPRHSFQKRSPSVFQFSSQPSSTYYGASSTASPSVIQISLGTEPTTPSSPSVDTLGGQRVVDVEASRLDRRPIGPSGISVSYLGATKIIRIRSSDPVQSGRYKDDIPPVALGEESNFAMLPPEEQAVTVYPDPDAPSSTVARKPAHLPIPEARPEAQVAASVSAKPDVSPTEGFEPWTQEWLRDCVARYPDFDASLGTFINERGRRQFCVGQP